jgi:hypothetical protein
MAIALDPSACSLSLLTDLAHVLQKFLPIRVALASYTPHRPQVAHVQRESLVPEVFVAFIDAFC